MKATNTADAKKSAQQFMTHCTIIASVRVVFSFVSVLTAFVAGVAAFNGWEFWDRFFAFAAFVLLAIEATVFGLAHVSHTLRQRRKYRHIIHDANLRELTGPELEVEEPESFPLSEYFAEEANKQRWKEVPSPRTARFIMLVGIVTCIILLLGIVVGLSFLAAHYLPTPYAPSHTTHGAAGAE